MLRRFLKTLVRLGRAKIILTELKPEPSVPTKYVRAYRNSTPARPSTLTIKPENIYDKLNK